MCIVVAMSTTKTKSYSSSRMGGKDSADSNQQVRPKRKAPAKPGSADKSASNSNKAKRINNSDPKANRKTSTSSLKEEESNSKAKRKTSTSSIKEEGTDEIKDSKLRRVVSPRKEQYSHLLDEMVGCGDMVLLEPLTEDNIIENLKKRYTAGDIYVRIHLSTLYLT